MTGANSQPSKLRMNRMKHFICEILKFLHGIFIIAIAHFVLYLSTVYFELLLAAFQFV